MIIFSDLHLREDSEGMIFREVLPGLEKAVEDDRSPPPYARKLVCLGDLWDVRYRLPVLALNRLVDWVLKLTTGGNPTHLLLLPGNHDQVNPAGDHALHVLSKLPGVQVYSQPAQDAFGLWMPYRKDVQEVQRQLARFTADEAVARGVPLVLWIHHGIRGALRNDQATDTDGLDPASMASRFTRVFAGHYHKPQEVLPTVHYVGSPYEVHADERGQQKRICRWDGHSPEWLPVQWGPRTHKLDLGLVGDIQALAETIRLGDRVQVVVQAGDEQTAKAEALRVELARRGVVPVLTPAQARLAVPSRLQVQPQAGLGEYARAYVQAFHGELPEDRLLATLDALRQG